MIPVCILLAVALLDLQPPPQQIAVDDRRVFQFRPGVPVLAPQGTALEQRAVLRPLLDALPYAPPILSGAQSTTRGPAILIGEPGTQPRFENRAYRRALRDLPSLGPEGYFLRISQDGVLVAGNTPRGTYRGLGTLSQIVRQSGNQWPCLEIRDRPAVDVRAVFLRRQPTEAELDTLAALHCNFVVLDHEDFQLLDADATQLWQEVFRQSRARQIEPVPSFHFFHAAARLLAHAPLAAEGRTTSEQLVLHGYEPAFLRRPRPLLGAESRAEVTVSGMPCAEGTDYTLSALADDGNGLWALRRVVGSRIPNGASVALRYAHAPVGTEALCPAAPESAPLIREALERLLGALGPAYLYVGPELVTRINEDPRCAIHERSDTEALLEGVRQIHAVADALRPGIRLLVSGRAHLSDGTPLSWPPPTQQLPEGSLLIGYDAGGGPTTALLGVSGNVQQAYHRAREAAQTDAVGLVIHGDDPLGLEVGLARAWNSATPLLSWPEGFNAHFGAALWRPDFEVRLDAMIAYLNRELRKGATPKELRSAFDTLYGRLQRPLASDPELGHVRALFANLIEYLELEAVYAQDPQRASLTKLAALVLRQADLDPRFDVPRRDRIVETVEKQGLFVPASILFGSALDYYRPLKPTSPSASILPWPVRPEFRDRPHRTEAHLNLVGFPLPVVRINFETVAAERVLLESSEDGVSFSLRQTWTSAAPWGVRGPVLPQGIAGEPHLRLAAESKNQSAVLRELEVLALKQASLLRVPLRNEAAPALQRALRGNAWPDAAQAAGFVTNDGTAFAVAPTTVRVARNRTHLYFVVEAHEPRMHAMVATLKTRDAPLWEEESFEIRMQPPGGASFWFIVNPLGTQFDARRGDAAWDALWTADVVVGASAWTALLSLPIEIFDAEPIARSPWRIEFVRNRSNAVSERSRWTVQEFEGDAPTYGTLSFD